jgi:hypothetical protein
MSARKRIEMREAELSNVIVKELGSETNRRFLNRMPGLRAEHALPQNLRSLLERLDEVEDGPRTYRH